MIKEKTIFQSSINIKFDYGSSSLYERYLPTPSHVESLKGLLKGFNNEGQHAHIIVGPYGSGKSLLGTIVSGVVSKNITNDFFVEMVNKFQTVDPKISHLFTNVKKMSKKFIPVILNGNEGNFKKSLLTAIYKTLFEQNLDFTQPLLIADILSIVDVWKVNYEETFKAFVQQLEREKWDLPRWKKDIENVDVDAIEWFKRVYPTLTSGSVLSINYDKHLLSQLKHVLAELHDRQLGLFIVYDEFGRMLQSLAPSEIHRTMQDLQDLAEYANKNEFENLNVLLITHRNFAQYALDDKLTQEFQRIEKRYNTYYTKADPATFIRLSSVVTQEFRNQKGKWQEFLNDIRLFNLFPDLNVSELQSLIVKGSYPVHPVTLFVMPHLANLVAQNERTLFTFLESDEPGGLRSYFEKHGDWYRVDQMFDYFEPAIAEFEVNTLIGQTYQKFQKLRKKIIDSPIQSDELKLIKLLAIWNISNIYSLQIPNDDFISFAFSWDAKYTKQIIGELTKKKIIRFNSQNDYWEIFEGSGINVEQEVRNKLQVEPVNKRRKMELLRSVLQNKFVLPKKYNDDKSMTRFAPIIPLYASEFNDEENRLSILKEQQAMDAIIVYIFNDTGVDDRLYLDEQLLPMSYREEKVIYSLCSVSHNFDEQVETLAVLVQLKEDKYFLSQDKYLFDEITALASDLTFRINMELQNSLKREQFTWIYAGEQLSIKSEISLGKKISDIMSDIYTNTPEIRNEAFNRRKITKVQKSGAIQVVNRLIQYHTTHSLEIDGFGPEYLIYATVVKNNGIGLEYPQIIQSESLRNLRENLLLKLQEGKGHFTDLIDLFIGPPYGIRNAVIPVLLPALLIHEWKYIMFYHNGMNNSQVTGELLYHMIENPSQYTFAFQPFDEKYIPVVKHVESTFVDHVSEEENALHPAVYVNRILLRWLRWLPRITQNTAQLSTAANRLKDIIKKGQVEPDVALELLSRYHEKNQNKLAQVKAECESYNVKHKDAIEKSILEAALCSSYDQLHDWANNRTIVVKTANPLIKAIVSSSNESWVEFVCERVVGVRREHWSDTTDQLFSQQVDKCLEDALKENYDSYIEINLGDSAIAIPKVELSTKSKSIFQTTKANMTQMARTISKAEIQVVLLELLKEFSKE